MTTPAIQACELPAGSLLLAYRRGGAFADCYVAQVPGAVSHADFVEAFYTSPVFRLERAILRLAGWPASDADARELADGCREAFAAWTVEGRAERQLLLADMTGRTRSWLMTAPVDAGPAGAGGTRLYFGSAVVPRRRAPAGPLELGLAFRALLGFHKLYSRALLRAARARIARGR
jgi:hypothetical protein